MAWNRFGVEHKGKRKRGPFCGRSDLKSRKTPFSCEGCLFATRGMDIMRTVPSGCWVFNMLSFTSSARYTPRVWVSRSLTQKGKRYVGHADTDDKRTGGHRKRSRHSAQHGYFGVPREHPVHNQRSARFLETFRHHPPSRSNHARLIVGTSECFPPCLVVMADSLVEVCECLLCLVYVVSAS